MPQCAPYFTTHRHNLAIPSLYENVEIQIGKLNEMLSLVYRHGAQYFQVTSDDVQYISLKKTTSVGIPRGRI